MKIFPTNIIKNLDAYTIQHEPITSINLMERAARTIAQEIVKQWPAATPVTIFAGPGNNGGDALAVARMLSQQGYKVEAYLFNPHNKLSPDCLVNKELLEKTEVHFAEVRSEFTPPKLTDKHLVIDGLFGSGLNQPLVGGFAAVVKYINSRPGTVLSIDIPSGLMGEDNSYHEKAAIIKANYTFSLQFPKLAFLFADNAEYVGEWKILDIGISSEVVEETETNYHIIEQSEVRELIKKRSNFAHKGDFGHALLIAGSYGMAGASVLSARACLKSGVGLLTVHVPGANNAIVQTSVPEAMIDPDFHEHIFAFPAHIDEYDAIAIGPGLGTKEETKMAVLEQIRSCDVPMVIDADALNILSTHRQTLLSKIPKGSVLTPHPGELDRLVGKSKSSYERLTKACELAREAKVCVVLKGAWTAIITPDGECAFNPTGNPGMATAGSGDVLTGIILALLAQGYTAKEAAMLGAYVHGWAGDMAKDKYGVISLTAGNIVEYIHEAWRKVSDF